MSVLNVRYKNFHSYIEYIMLGIHVKKVSSVLTPPNRDRKTLAKAIELDCATLGLDSAQIFSHGPRNHARNLDADEISKIKKLSKTINISVHSSYPSVAIWKLTHENKHSNISKRIIGHIKDQLECCALIGATGLVIHISRKPVAVICEAMEVILDMTKKIGVPIWLEMISSKAHDEYTYETPEKLNRLVSALDHLDSWGLCIDTAHIWGSGTDISGRAHMEEWFNGLTARARKKIRMFHLNGSASEFGSGKDKHEIAFCRDDLIYHSHAKNPNASGVKSVIKFCTGKNIPVILEINRGSEADAITCVNIITDMEKSCRGTHI